MKRVICSVLAAGLVGLVGCKEGTSTAPSKPGVSSQPGKPMKLTVKTTGNQTVTQDQTDEMTVTIGRENFTGPVKIALSDLPKGVEVVTKDMTIPAGKDSVTVTVKAAPDAAVATDHLVKVTATAEDESSLQPAPTDFKLTVKAKK